MGRLNGKVALITGGAGGCGLAASELFAREGARVAILDLPRSDGKAVAERINAAGGTACFVATDVSVADQVNSAVAQVEERFGAITVLMNINVKSMFLVTRAVLPKMIEAGGGSVICTSSISGVVGTPMEVLYCTTKGACHMFARAISVEYRDRNIRSNAICPGFIGTAHGRRELDLLREFGTEVSDEALRAMQGRLCDPAEVAAAALFLASDDSSFVNGTHLFVDNAYTAA